MTDVSNYNSGYFDYTCPSEITPDPPGTRSHSHYIKRWISDYSRGSAGVQHYYEEQAIVMPFMIRNYYTHTDFKRPFCLVDKYTYEKGRTPKFYFKQVTRLEHIVEVLPYKKMQSRLKTVVLFS